MNLATLSDQISLESLYDDLFFTLVQLRAALPAARLVPDWEKLLKDWVATVAQERGLREGAVLSQAQILQFDRLLDSLVDRLDLSLLRLCNGKREAPLYTRYFGSLPPSRLKKPTLGKQLTIMRDFVPSLKATGEPELKALSADIAKAVSAAEGAVADLGAARARLADFRKVGDRKRLFDDANALRTATYAALSALPAALPAESLPADYADGFFRKSERERLSPADAASDLRQRIAESEAELSELRAALVSEEARQAAEAQAERELAAAALALAEAKKKLAEQAEQVAALEKTLPKPKRPSKKKKDRKSVV